MATFPPAREKKIIDEIWHTEMPSAVRQSFMTTSPRINRTWKAVFVPIVSQDIYTQSLASVYYLCDIAGRQKSAFYHDLIPQFTRIITCFADLREKGKERVVVKEVYILFRGYLTTLASEPVSTNSLYILRASYYGNEIRSLPVHIRYDCFLSQCRNGTGKEGYLRLDIHISIKTHSPRSIVSFDTFHDLRNTVLGPPRLFLWSSGSVEYE